MAKKKKNVVGESYENYASNEELVKSVTTEAEEYFNHYQSQRTELEDDWKIADFMYAAGQNRSLLSSEKSKGVNLSKDTRANTGSTMFFRQVNTQAANLVQICRSHEDLFKYRARSNPDVEGSGEATKARAMSMNLLARWSREKDGINARLPEFATHIFKYSTVFALFYWKRVLKQVKKVIPTVVVDEVTSQNTVTEETVDDIELVENYPCIEFPHVSSIYADAYIPTIQKQNCVFVLSTRNRTEIYGDVASGYFDAKQYEKLDPEAYWDGNFGGEAKRNELLNREREFNPSGSQIFLQWDVFIRVGVENGKYDVKLPPKLMWATYIGNSIGDAVCVRLQRNIDADDEIPLKEIRVNADNPDMLYHTSNHAVIRSLYATDCTLLNLALDNMAVVNDPPITVKDGTHRIRDFTFIKGQRWHVDEHDALKQWEVRDVTQNTAALRAQVREEMQTALATDPNMMGQYAGARTSATEVMSVSNQSRQPHLVTLGYVLAQFLPWMAQKYASGWNLYGFPTQVVQITDQDKQYVIHPADIAGEFDVDVDIIDEYQDSLLRQNSIDQVMQVIAGSPALQKSATHEVDMGKLVKEWLASKGWNKSEIVRAPSGADADSAARYENTSIMEGGQYIEPKQGQDHQTHIAIHESEVQRWEGIEPATDPRVGHLTIMAQHIAAHKAMMQQGSMPEQADPNMEVAEGPQTEGQAMGGIPAGVIGAMQGGGAGL